LQIDVAVPVVSGVGEGIRAIGIAAEVADTVHDTSKAVKAVENVSDNAEVGFETTQEFLQNAANSVKSPVTGHVSGTKQHSAFKSVVDSAKNDRLKTEISFKDGEVVPYGRKGSVRIDVLECDESGKIIAAYDLKTGSAKLNQKQIDAIRKNTGIFDLPVFEIKPQ